MDPENDSVVPPYLLPGIFVDFAADNVDILGEKLNGKNTFHATQIAAWQKGAESNLTLENLKPSTKHSLSVPESNDTVAVKRSSPVFPGAVRKEWFDAVDDDKDSVSTAKATDMAFNTLRHKKQ